MNDESPSIAICLQPAPMHQLPGHPERPGRLELLADLPSFAAATDTISLDPEIPDPALLTRVHDSAYLDLLAETSGRSDVVLLDGGDTYATGGSWAAAQRSAGAALAVTEAVLSREVSLGFALARPPGHHATANRAMGFCLLNNVALACVYAQRQGSKRTAILDIDVHHGNGTQAIFDGQANTAYLSIHQRGIFPGTGHLGEIGRADGTGTSLNLPLPPGIDDSAYLEAVDRLILPFLRRFEPQLMFVSVGFDAHWRDPLAQFQLTERCYYEIARRLRTFVAEYCEGRMVWVLEGGYDPEAVARSAEAMLNGVLDAPAGEWPSPVGPPTDVRIDDILARAADLHDLG